MLLGVSKCFFFKSGEAVETVMSSHDKTFLEQ